MDLRHSTTSVCLTPDLASITRIVRRDDHNRIATDLHRRYQRLYIGADVATGILEFLHRATAHREAATQRFESLRERWERRGGYLETVTVEDVSRWIRSRSYIVAEATDPKLAAANEFIAVAQAVFHLPDEEWLVPRLVEPRDEIVDPALYYAVCRDGPRASALVDYLGVLPEWAQNKLAGAARHAGMREIIRLNALRAERSRVRWAVGVAYAVQGLTLPSGKSVVLADLGQSEIVNQASMRAIGSSTRCPAGLVGKWRSAPPVPVVVDGRTYHLDVDWNCYVRDLVDVL